MPNHVFGCKTRSRTVRTSAPDGYLRTLFPKFELHKLVFDGDVGKSKSTPCSLPSDTTVPEITVFSPSPFASIHLIHVSRQQNPYLDTRLPDRNAAP
jgi:hypothetical protein